MIDSGVLRADLPHRTTDCFPSDTETLYNHNGSPYARAMKHNNMNRGHLTPDRSPAIRQTRSSSNNAAAAASSTAVASVHTNGTLTRNRSLSMSSSKRKAAAAKLSDIKVDPPPLKKKRKRTVKDEIEVQLPNARSRESSTATSVSTLSTRRSSSSMPPPSVTSPNTSPPMPPKPAEKNINKKHPTGETLLHRAAAAGKEEEVRDLIERGASVNVQCNAGWTPLHKACLKGFVPIVRLLCESGAKTDIQSKEEHDTPLHDACSNGHLEVVRVLLEYGANPHIQNSEGSFPHEMVDGDDDELKIVMVDAVNTFKEKRESTAHEDREDSEPPMSPATKRHSRRTSTASDSPLVSQTRLHGRPKRGAQSGRLDLLSLDINYRDKERRGHLHLSAFQGNDDLVRDLLEIGAPHSAKDREGNTPLHLAARGGHYKVVEVLLGYGAEVNALNIQRETPIHEVAGRGHKDIVDILLFYGSDPTLKDLRGQTALDVAMEKKSTAAEGEIELFRDKLIEMGVEPSVDVKMEDVDEVSELIKAVEHESPEAPETNGTEEVEMVVEGQPIPTRRESTPPEETPSPIISVTADVTIPPGIRPSNEATDPTAAPVDLTASTTPMEEVIQQEPAPARSAPTEQVSPPTSLEFDNAKTVPEVHNSPEAAGHPSPPSPPEAKEASSIPAVPEPTEEPITVEVPQLGSEPPKLDLPEPMSVDEVIEEAEVQEPEIQIPSPKEARASSLPPSEPQWRKLASLESLDASLHEQVSRLLPLYTMNLKNDTNNFVTFVAHPQICTLLGFTTREFFENCIPLVIQHPMLMI